MPDSATPPPEGESAISLAPRRGRRRRIVIGVFVLVAAWGAVAYLVMPDYWKRYVRKHPSLADVPGVTRTSDGMPGDPINVALVGTKESVVKALAAAKWFPADPLSIKSDLKIAEATVLKRPYDTAPVSDLFLFGRKEDLAYEQPVGDDPRQRHHVRFWETSKRDGDGRPIWVGAAIYDTRVGLSHETGEITHHTGPDIDAERDHLFDDLKRGGDLVETYAIDGFHTEKTGRNGGGDPWHTDGELYVGVTKSE